MTFRIITLLDMSGSMADRATDAVGGYNSFIKQQQEVGDDATATLVLFDQRYIVAYKDKPITEVEPLTDKVYIPAGSTALNDAICKAINEAEDNPRTILSIITDGFENSSREFRLADVKAKIEQKQAQGWDIIYLGAEQDAFTEGTSRGLLAANTMSFAASAKGFDDAYTMYCARATTARGSYVEKLPNADSTESL